MKSVIDYGLKTTDGERLIWWRTTADADHWNERFSETIAALPAMAASGRRTRMVQLILQYMPTGGRILEAGCGSGWLVRLLRDAGRDAEGVDYSTDLVASVCSAYPDLPVRFGDVLALDVPDDTYSGYISLGVIEHRREGCLPFLLEAKRVTRPGGMLFIAVPYYNGLRRMLYGARRDADPSGKAPFYQYGFSEDFFRRAIAEAGLELVTFVTYGVKRCLQEEIPVMRRLLSTRAGRLADRLDGRGFPFSAHMIAAVARKPEKG
jgi:SAM-dependent methyltransferase